MPPTGKTTRERRRERTKAVILQAAEELLVEGGLQNATLTQIAQVYDMDCEVVALPNILMIKVGQSAQELADFTVQRPATCLLNQISALVELVDQVQHKRTLPAEASRQVDRILALPPRFNSVAVIFGYFLSIIGLTMLFRLDAEALIVTGAASILVGLLVLLFQRWPRFNLLLPVIAAIVASTLIFNLTRLGYIYGSANLLIVPLITFLPGALLTTLSA